jgi:hypothetical protein
MANAWVEHIKRFAREKGMTYGCALSDPECKATYKKPPRPLTQKKERESMGAEDASAKAIVAEEKAKKSAHKARTTTMKAKVNKKQVEKQLVETMGMKGEDRDTPAPPSREPAQSNPEPPAKKKGGRPKKYSTAEEAREAKRLMTKESDKRRKEAKKAIAQATAPITPAEAKELRKQLLDKKKTEGKGLKGGSGATDFFNKIGNAFKTSFNNQGSPQERQATSVILNKIEPALIKPLQVLAPPVGDIANAQREGLKQHYGLGLAKKRGRPPKVVGGATPDQMGLSSVLRTYTKDEIFFALNDITHSADSLPTLAKKWDDATNSQERYYIERQVKEILQNPYRIIDAKGDIVLTDPDGKAQATLRKALQLIFGSTTLPPVISKSLRTFKLPPKLEATLPKRQPPTPAQIQNAIQDNLPPPSAKATTPPSPATTASASSPPTPAPSTLKATATAFVPPAPAPSLMDFAKVKKAKPTKGKGLNAGYSTEADNGLGHIYPISHDLILRMCEHLV